MRVARGAALLGCVATMILAAGCSEESEPLAAPTVEPIVERDEKTGTVDFYAPNDTNQVLAPGGDPVEAALGWIDAKKNELGIPNGRESFEAIATTKDDEDGSLAVRLQLVAGGLSVWGVQSVVHFDADGSVLAFDGPYIPNLDAIAKQVPAIDEATARAKAGGSSVDVNELVVYVEDDYTNPKLARHVRTFANAPVETFVDAMTGEVIDHWVDAHGVAQTARGLGGVTHEIDVHGPIGDDRHWQMHRQPTDGRHAVVPRVWSRESDPYDPVLAEGRSVVAPSQDGPWDAQAVSAYANTITTDHWYRDVLRFEGPDGRGTRVDLFTHYMPGDYYGAFTPGNGPGYPQRAFMFFSNASEDFASPAIALDIVAHEYTHLVNGFHIGLGAVREPGAINESLADIFGAFVEFASTQNERNALRMSEATGGIAHEFLHPTRNPDRRDHYSERRRIGRNETPGPDNDNGHSHNNSTIMSNAWALMTVGGTHDHSDVTVARTLGWNASRRLWWRTQRQIVTARSTMPRIARMQSMVAQRSRGRFDVRAVACGWLAVGALRPAFVRNTLRVRCDDVARSNESGPPANEPAPTESCGGKTDGVYCSTTRADVGYTCQGGKIVVVECLAGRVCKGAYETTEPGMLVVHCVEP
jgi:bacillolysin